MAMHEDFQKAVRALFAEDGTGMFPGLSVFDGAAPDSPLRTVAAFLRSLTGEAGPHVSTDAATHDSSHRELAAFLDDALRRIADELAIHFATDESRAPLQKLSENPDSPPHLRAVFLPEAHDLPEQRASRVTTLRERRRVRISSLNPRPIRDPIRQLVFTSNVLLTIPAEGDTLDDLAGGPELARRVLDAANEPQAYWYDHPVQIGVSPEGNEILYGLRGLDQAVAFEKPRHPEWHDRAVCILSASVTHHGLQAVAREYIESEIRRAGGFPNLDVYVFTEADTNTLIHEVLGPAAQRYLQAGEAPETLRMFGVDGAYGRHYSFLKAISALWHVLRDPHCRGTFKIDLDQVFPQPELVAETGRSALEHFCTPLWGAQGKDHTGRETELGMIAGALVNEKDISQGLFTPDVPFPDAEPDALEHRLFFSRLLMALSTEAELMTRYRPDGIDGIHACIHRIHVTGGTNGILINSLRRFRPFTPSFIARAEDQAYIMSVLMNAGTRLAYAHADGLIMRHDKQAFAGNAIKAAAFGNLVGDPIRTLYFSEYARALTDNHLDAIKSEIDPFTGCFATPLPVTVVLLRFCLRTMEFAQAGDLSIAERFVLESAPRLARATAFTTGNPSPLITAYQQERVGWDLYYDTLGALETAIQDDAPDALAWQARARQIINGCLAAQGEPR